MGLYGRDPRSNTILGVSENEGTPPYGSGLIGKIMIFQWMEVSYFDANRHGPKARGSSEFKG